MNKKLIALWGNPDSGKTTLAIKLALELEKRNQKVIILHADNLVPVLGTILPESTQSQGSLGDLLALAQISQEAILAKSFVTKDHKNLCHLSYLVGESQCTYAKYTRERVLDLFILLRHLADVILIDCSSRIQEDLLTKTALESCDLVFRIISPDLKALAYFDSNMPIIHDNKNMSHHVKVLSKVEADKANDLVSNRFGGHAYEFPSCYEIRQQTMEGRLFGKMTSKEGLIYEGVVKSMISEILVNESASVDKPLMPESKEIDKAHKAIKDKKEKVRKQKGKMLKDMKLEDRKKKDKGHKLRSPVSLIRISKDSPIKRYLDRQKKSWEITKKGILEVMGIGGDDQ